MTSAGESDYWIKSLGLFASDRECLTSSRWVTDSLISGALKLLKEDYPNTGGLQPTILGETLNFEVQRGIFVQVRAFLLNCSSLELLYISIPYRFCTQEATTG